GRPVHPRAEDPLHPADAGRVPAHLQGRRAARHVGLQLLPQPGEVLAHRRRQRRGGPRRPPGARAAAPHPARPDDLSMADKAYQIAFDDEAVDEDFYGDVESLTVEENTATAGL